MEEKDNIKGAVEMLREEKHSIPGMMGRWRKRHLIENIQGMDREAKRREGGF